jgi:hypothetical protein
LKQRLLRGGSFNNQALNVRSANRNTNQPDNRNNNYGFRASRTSDTMPELISREKPQGIKRADLSSDVDPRLGVQIPSRMKNRPIETSRAFASNVSDWF